jgi:hypothetical protein
VSESMKFISERGRNPVARGAKSSNKRGQNPVGSEGEIQCSKRNEIH